ncbi:MAG: hypothetical protein U0X91_19665 [Spirosomataceae bacterium]
MKQFISFLFVFLFIVQVQAQKCMGLSVKAGMGFEMANFNAKDKQTGKLLYTIKDVTNDNGTTVLKMEMQTFDGKDKPQMTNSYQCRCKGNELMIDMTSMMAAQENPMLKDAKMTFTSNDLIYGDTYTVGAALKDASLNGEGTMGGGMNIMYSMVLKNRKVTGKESMTVPAGTFEVYKIASDMTITNKTLVNLSFDFQTVSYRTPEVLWDIKTETYRKDKLMGYSVLTKIF